MPGYAPMGLKSPSAPSVKSVHEKHQHRKGQNSFLWATALIIRNNTKTLYGETWRWTPGFLRSLRHHLLWFTENQVAGFIYKKNLHFIYRKYCSNFPSSIRTDFLRENHWALLSGPRPEAQANTTKGSIHLLSIKHHNRNTPSSLWGQRVKELLKMTEDCNPLTDKTRREWPVPGPLFVIALLCAVACRQDKIPLGNCYLKVIRGWEHSTVSKASTRIQDWSPEPCKKAQHTGLCL